MKRSLLASAIASSERTRSTRLTRVSPIAISASVGLDADIGRLVRLLLWRRGRGRQIDRQVDGRQRRRHHEDDQQNQDDVDEGRDVDLASAMPGATTARLVVLVFAMPMNEFMIP